ncbi:DUF1918 domain-containing protein [Micromonospora aurantiaca]
MGSDGTAGGHGGHPAQEPARPKEVRRTRYGHARSGSDGPGTARRRGQSYRVRWTRGKPPYRVRWTGRTGSDGPLYQPGPPTNPYQYRG